MQTLDIISKYVPLFQTLSWIVFISVIVFVFKKQLFKILKGLGKRISKGSLLKAFGVEIGEEKLVTETSQIKNAKVYGDPDLFKLLFKAETETFQKSTKAMEVSGGCLVQVSTEKLSKDGTWTVAEAITFVPNVRIKEKKSGNGRYIE